MRIPLMSMFVTSPFEGIKEHAVKIKECAWAFQQAIECYISHRCQTFEVFRQDVIRLESEADAIKRRIRGHLPVGTLMPVSKFQLFRYLREQDSVMDAMEDALDWISYRSEPGIPADLEKDFFLLVNAVIDPVEELATIEEAGACGTAAVISPIGKVADVDKGITYSFGDGVSPGPVSTKLYETLLGIQNGDLEDSFGWIKILD